MTKPTFIDPFDNAESTKPAFVDPFETDAPTSKPEPKSGTIRRALGDTGVSLLKGAIGVPETMVGIADLVTGGHAGKLAESAGFKPKQAKEFISDYYSPEQKLANQKVQEADGFVNTIKAALQNPSTIAQTTAESLPVMGLGGVASRGLLTVAPKVAPLIAGAAGEGLVTAGQNAEQVRQENADGLLTGKQAAIQAGSGLLTGAISGVSGNIAQKLGIADIETMLAQGKLSPSQLATGLPKAIAGGIVTEGLLEEAPQSAQEQIAQNLSLDKPWDEGVGNAAAMGALSGGLMGGGANALNAFGGKDNTQVTPPPAPPAPAGSLTSAATIAQAAGLTPQPVTPDVTEAKPNIVDSLNAVEAQQNGVMPDTTIAPEKPVAEMPAPTLAPEQAAEKQIIDEQAQQAATSPLNDLPQPTEKQVEAGNYKKGHIKYDGLNITVENPQGSTRSGVDEDGKTWENTLKNHYGYIKRTKGNDGDNLDVFVGDKPANGKVFVINQTKKDGSFDEHKAVLGAETADEAIAIYKSNYADDWNGGKSVTELTTPAFKDWLKNGDPTKPLETVSATNNDVDMTKVAVGEQVDVGGVPYVKTENGFERVTSATENVADAPVSNAATNEVNPATPTQIEPATLPAADSYTPEAYDYVKKNGEFAFNDEAQAQRYAERLQAGEGGAWQAQQVGNQWRAVRQDNVDGVNTTQERVDEAANGVQVPAIRKGEVGGMLAAKEVVTTASGRSTTPFPNFNGKNGKVSNFGLKAVDKWLVDNAIAEAESRNDDFNLTQFKAINLKNLSQADKDGAEEYLFGSQPAVVPSILKPLVNEAAITPENGITQEAAPANESVQQTHTPKANTKPKSNSLLAKLKALGGVTIKDKRDVTGEDKKFAPGGYNRIFMIKSQRSLKGLIESGDLDEYLPYNMRLEANGANDDAFDSTPAYDYLADKIRNGEHVLPYAVVEEAQANQFYQEEEATAESDVQEAATLLTEEEINEEFRIAGNEEREATAEATEFKPDSEKSDTASGTGRKTEPQGTGSETSQVAEVPQEQTELDKFKASYSAKSDEEKADFREMLQDAIVSAKENRKPYQQYVDRLSIAKQIDEGVPVDATAIFSNAVEGHPENNNYPLLRNLVPISVRSLAEIERKINFANDLYADANSKLSKAEYAFKIAKTPKEKRDANVNIKKLESEFINREAVDALRNETLPELNRLYKLAEERFKTESQPTDLLGDNTAAKPDLELTGQTNEDINAGIAAHEAEARAQQEQAKADEAARIEAERKSRQEIAADSFDLTQTGKDAKSTKANDAKVIDNQFAGQGDLLSQPAEQPKPETKAAEKVDDFGEKLEGARKDMVRAMAKEYSDDELASLPLSKIWPASDVNLIENKTAAAIAWAAREEMPSKPRKPYAVRTWVGKVKVLRDIGRLVNKALEVNPELMLQQIKDANLGHFKSKVALLEAIDREQWKRIGKVEEYPNAYRYEGSSKVPSPLVNVEIDGNSTRFDASSVADIIDKINEKLGVAAQDKRMAFEVRGARGTYFINKKGDKNYTKLKTFDSSKEAFAFIRDNYDEVVAAWEATKDRLNVKESDVRNKENRPRTGEDYRNGKDVTTEQFATTFGFRGVQFGEWVKQGGKDNDRQGALNAAYDALMDLANIVGVPPQALSLEGTLGLSFGARGHGKAAAHFEPSMLVINLTKTQGAGTLAHEWFHALDNYFSRKRGGEKTMADVRNSQQVYRESNYITYKPEPLYVHKDHGGKGVTLGELQRRQTQNPSSGYFKADNWIKDPKHPEGVRPEVEERFAALVEALNVSPMKQRAMSIDTVKEGTDGYWSRIIERAARSFENYVIHKMQLNGYDNDYLANVVKVESFGRDSSRFPYLLDEEIAPVAEAFDNLFSTLKTKETDKGIALYQNKEEYGNYGITEKQRSELTEPERRAYDQSAATAIALRGVKNSVLGLAVSKDFKQTGSTSLLGKQIATPEDLAVAAQVYRDPRFETVRYFFIKDGSVISQTSVTSKLAGVATLSPNVNGDGVAEFISEIATEAANLGADGVYLLHNHPDGNPTPSKVDVTATKFIQDILAEKNIDLLGHVIINHQKYAVIDRENNQQVIERKFENTYSNENPAVPHAILGKVISDQYDLAEHAKAIEFTEGNVVLIGTSGMSGISVITEIEPADLKPLKLAAILRKLSRQSGAESLFAYNVPLNLSNLAAKAIKNSILVDAITTDTYGNKQSLRSFIDPDDNVTMGRPLKGYVVKQTGVNDNYPTSNNQDESDYIKNLQSTWDNAKELTDEQARNDIDLLRRSASKNGILLTEQTLSTAIFKAITLPKQRELDLIAKQFGKRLVGFAINPKYAGELDAFDGVTVTNKNIIFLRAGTERPHLALLGHELTHNLKAENSTLYRELLASIKPYVKDFANFAQHYEGVSLPDISEEFISDVVADGFMSDKFWNALGEHNPSLLSRVVDAVKNLINTISKKFRFNPEMKPYLTDYNKVMELAGKAMAKYANKDTAFSRPQPKFARQSNTIDIRDLNAVVANVNQALRGLPATYVLEDYTKAPAELVADIKHDKAYNAAGAWHNGEIYLFRNNIINTNHALFTMLHESTHEGLRRVFGKEIDATLMGIYLSNQDIKQQADSLRATHKDLSLVASVEEALADMGGNGIKASVMDKLIAFVRNALRRLGRNLSVSDSEVRAIVTRALDSVKSPSKVTHYTIGSAYSAASSGDQTNTPEFKAWFGDSKVVDADGKPLVVYHGGKDKINVFDERFGGETTADNEHGAFYFSNSEQVGEDYSREAFKRRYQDNPESLVDDGFATEEDVESHEEANDVYEWVANLAENNLQVVQGFLSMQNPLIIDAKHQNLRDLEKKFHIQNAIGFMKGNQVDEIPEQFYDEMSYLQSDIDDFKSEIEDRARDNNGLEADDTIEDYMLNEATDEVLSENGFEQELPEYDGLIIKNVIDDIGYGSAGYQDVYIALYPTQIKSATGNNGDFDPTNPDIRYSRPTPRLSPVVQPTTPNQQWQSPDKSKLDNVIYMLQNKFVDLKRVTQAIQKSGNTIEDKWNPYLLEENFTGRTAKRTKDFLKQELEPLMKSMQARKVEMADFEEYLWARHAEERNIQIAKINPAMQDGGSGMKTQDARDYLANLTPVQTANYQALAAKVDAILKTSRQRLIAYGLETPETIAAWEGAYQHYVPLMREDMDNGFGNGSGQGFSVKGNASKRATGSKRAVVDVLANIAQQVERNIIRGEKNRVSTALVGLATLNPNKDFWKVDVVPKMRTVVAGKNTYEVLYSGSVVQTFTNPVEANKFIQWNGAGYTLNIVKGQDLVMDVPDPSYKNRDNIVVARIVNAKGQIEEHFVEFNTHDERAMRAAASIKNLDQDQIGELLGTASSITRYFSSINTQYNPFFGVINILRDVQGSLLNLSSTPLAGKQLDVMKNTPLALKGIYQDIRSERKTGTPTNSFWSLLFEDFQKQGGQTGYRDMYRNAKERGEALKHALDPTWWQQTTAGKIVTINGILAKPEQFLKEAGQKYIFDWLSDYNESMENAVRLSAYKVALDNGMSKAQAASLAKNISVNFNRKGEMGRQIGSLYAFFNASVQGTARIGETLFTDDNGKLTLSKAGKAIVTGGLLLGVMQALMLAAAGFGDDEPPEFVRDRNLIIPLGNGKAITIAMPLGFNALPAFGRILTEWALSGGEDTSKRFVHIFDMLAEVTNPIGNAGLSMQTLVPTMLDPLAALAENKDWTGRPIAKMDFNSQKPTAGHTRAKDTASAISKGLSWVINEATGGSDYTPGALSPTPDQIDYLLGQIFGGVGREYMKLEQSATSIVTGEELPVYKIPLIGRFYLDAEGQSSQSSRFYDNLKSVFETETELKGLRKDGLDTAEYRASHPEAALVFRANLEQREISQLYKIRSEKLKADASPDEIKALNERITARMLKFNELFKTRTTAGE